MSMREIYTAIVSRTNDPEKRGRIRVKCQSLAGANVELPFWCEPCFPFISAGGFGWFFVPDVGSEVEIEVVTSSRDDEIPGESFISNPDVHYRAGLYSQNNPVPTELQTNYPRRRGFKTPSGHLLVMDDTNGSELLLLQSAIGSFLQMDKNGTATLEASSILMGKDATQYVALANLVSSALTTLKNAISSATPVPSDGGAALKAAILASLSSWPPNMAATKVKAK